MFHSKLRIEYSVHRPRVVYSGHEAPRILPKPLPELRTCREIVICISKEYGYLIQGGVLELQVELIGGQGNVE